MTGALVGARCDDRGLAGRGSIAEGLAPRRGGLWGTIGCRSVREAALRGIAAVSSTPRAEPERTGRAGGGRENLLTAASVLRSGFRGELQYVESSRACSAWLQDPPEPMTGAETVSGGRFATAFNGLPQVDRLQ